MTIPSTKKRFYANGNRASAALYVDGEVDGPFTAWYEDGSPQLERYYRRGKPIGEHREYYPNKQLKSFLSYKEGNLDGEQKSFYEDGTQQTSIAYKEGILAWPHTDLE